MILKNLNLHNKKVLFLLKHRKQSKSYAERKSFIQEKDMLTNKKVELNKIGEKNLLFTETFKTGACHNDSDQKQKTSKKIWRKENSF